MASAKKKKVFAQKQPPLSVAIRRILARYPDGQILKELLQNAEDADAWELRLILDLRQFGVEKLYDKRLSVCQGPALLAYNDAMFTEDDWENIKKTEHSHKQLDPKKIGRFGIGFNSIYHLTDFPWIMSGSTIGVFDPCERGIFRDPVDDRPVGGYQWDLTDDDDREQIREMSDQFAPFKYNNFDPEIDTHFNGTIFRFPLRQQFVEPKDPDLIVSKVTYTPQKIQALFEAFETDADRLLLFLTSVHKVSLWQWSNNNVVELYSAIKEIQFPSTIPKPLENVGYLCYYEAVIRVIQNKGLANIQNSLSKRWAILQFISDDPNIARFVSESELNLLPWVGVACPLDIEDIKTDGYISCFLPLPPDNGSQTGLPIQVHGYFCLSDSRRSVLWPSAATQNDPRPKWNEILANQLIPLGYAYLLKQIIKKNSNTDSHALISRLWPLRSQVKAEWKNFMVAFYKQTVNEKFFWSFLRDEWVTVSDAVFLNPLLRESEHNAITEVCSAVRESIVSLPSHIPNHFQSIARVNVTFVSPEYICRLLQQNPLLHYLLIENSVRKQLLNYVLSDHNCSLYLKDVPLLPLADGSFVSFNPDADPIYVSSMEHPQSLLPGLGSMFLSDEYCSLMSNVLETGSTQLRKLQKKDIPKLLRLSIRSGLWQAERDLENLWKYINRSYNVSMDLTQWQGLRIIPVQSEKQNFTTSCVDPAAPVLSSDGMDVNVCEWLKKEFGLKLALPMPYLKPWLRSEYILDSNKPGSTLKVIYQVWRNDPNVVVSVIRKAHSESLPYFLWFQDQILMSCVQSVDPNLRRFMTSLPLFCPVVGTAKGGSLISANEAKCYYFKDFRFEITDLLCQIGFPFPLMSFDSNSTLISKLNLKELPMATFVSVLLGNLNGDGYLSINQKTKDLVVSWVVAYYQELKRSSVAFNDLNNNLVLELFRKEILQKIHIRNQAKYANFCSIFLNANKTIWIEIRQLHMIPCLNNHLHCPTELVMSYGFKNTCPYICEPANWVKEKCEKFLSCCNIRKTLSFHDMINIVRNIQKDHRDAQKPLDEKTTLKGFLEAIDEIAKLSKKFDQVDIHKLKLPLPDSNGHLQPVDDLLYNDLSATDQSGYHVVHKAVPWHIALHFGAKTLRDVLLEKYEDKEEFGEEFGQEVDLVARIRRLLEQYHTQSDLFQEYLQNADDAGATKIAFLFDKRCHPVKGLVSEQYKELQGSAILIYNNSTFSDDDIRGIQQLGVGSKADDSDKIGRFGAGFNCAYRYTDCPSFISDDDVLCIFDPMQQFLNKSKKRGRKYDLSCQEGQSDFRYEFSAVYNTYRINGFPLKGGTMFRLPLRKIDRKSSLDKALEDPESEIYMLFNNVAPKMKEMMLFLRNVREVSAYQSDNHGNFKQLWQFQSEASGSTWMTKEEFGLKVLESAKCSPSLIPVTQSSYELLLKQADKLHEEKWLVCQRLGFQKAPVSVDFSKVKLLPVAGVATRLDGVDHKHSLFCSLPLPQKTELPVSINGHFSLDSEGRKNLFTTFEGLRDIRQKWNVWLLADVASNAYLDLLEVLKMKITDGKYFSNDNLIEKIMKFWTFVPHIKQHKSDSAWSGTTIFSDRLFNQLAESERNLFPCLSRCNGVSSIEWLNLNDNKTGPLFPSDASFHLTPHGNQLKNFFILLHELGVKIVPCPKFILKAFADASVPIQTARPTTVASYLKEPWLNLTTGNQKLPCPLAYTVFQSEKKVLSLLQYLIQLDELEFQLSDLGGLPLLVTCDKFLRHFSNEYPAKLEEDEIIGLFSEQTDKFVCKEFRSTLSSYLNGHGGHDATVTALNLEDLHRMLPGEMLHHGIQVQGEVPFCICPNQLSKMWLHRLWSLINRLITDEKNTNLFLQWFRNFYLIPAHMTSHGTLFLFKIDMRLQIVHPDMWKLISETDSIDGLPIVDSDGYFLHIRASFFGEEAMPKQLSDCLIYWNHSGFLKWPIEVQMFYDLLTYFAKSSLTSHTLNNLRNLPIFETFHGEFVSLGKQTVFTLEGQENLPENGQNIWMSKALFLKKHYNFLSLYKCLGIGHISSAELYADFIIPSFPEMTTDAQVVHLRYLNDRYHWDSFKATLLILKKTQFIQTSDENLKSVDQFYDHTIPLFTEMSSHEDFLPQYFFEALKTVDPEWLQGFLRRLGLKYIPSPEEHVQFAFHLSKLSLDTNLEKIKRISKLLLDSAASLSSSLPKLESAQNTKWHKSITQMSNIPFIPSMKLDKNLQTLYQSTKLDSVQLLKANRSCSSVCQTLVWTITRVLPDWVPLILCEKMSILTLKNRSCLELSIQHFEKLLDHLFLAKLQQRQDVGLNSLTSRATLKDVLNRFYIFLKSLQDNGSLDDNDRIKLMKLPLVVVEDGRHLAYPEMVVERLPVAYIKDRDYYAPFLYELPPDLHEYKALFQSLGLQQQPNVWHYATYLHKVYKHFHVSSEDGPNWDPNVHQSIMFVQQALVLSADKGVNWDNIHTLYLLSSDGKLYKSCELVFQDSSVAMQKHLPNNTKSLKFWKCSENMDTKFLEKMVFFVKLLPDRLKLKLSSEALSRCLSDKSECCQYNQPCPAVERLKTLFSSVEFLKSIQRLHYEQNSIIDLPNKRKWDEIDEQLKNIQIHCYSKLFIELKDMESSETIADSDREYKCFLDGKNLLISHEDASRVNGLFPYLLADCLPELLSIKLSETKLSALLICSDPNELESNLDQLHVPELPRNFISSHVPVLGSSVPVEYIDFLEMHPLNYFRNGEYVAFLKSDEEEAEADPMHNFIWAKINSCIDEDFASALCRHYEIDIGDPSGLIIVSALDLHKFIPQFKSLELGPLVPTNIVPESQSNTQSQKSKPFNMDLTEEEACKEVTRILEEAVNLPPNEYQKAIRRLYLTWHPDKNTEDRKTLATVVFQHLQSEIRRLEKGGTSSSDSSHPFHAHAWEKFRSNTNQRWNDFSHGRSRNPFNDFGFTSHTPYESPNRNMADKYWRTANDDLKAAFDARRCQNSEIGMEFGNEHVIILAQQAVEKALKAALFAEIGTAEKHHKLNYFAQRVADRTPCSKDIIYKVSKFVSECGVDLSRLRYPDGHSSRPHLTYTESQAVKAVDYATEIVEDLRKAFPAFTAL